MSEEPKAPPPALEPRDRLPDYLARTLREMEIAADRLRSILEPDVRWLRDTEDGRGWHRLLELLQAARDDHAVRESAPASGFVAIFIELVSQALPKTNDPMEVLAPLVPVLDSASQAKRGRRRHSHLADARQWVLTEWETHAKGYDFNKTDFAATYARLCLDRFGVTVRERTIREDWLKAATPKGTVSG